MYNPTSPWTEEVSAAARHLWEIGISASDVACSVSLRYGVDITRNAVIGRADRKEWVTPNTQDRNSCAWPRVVREPRPCGIDTGLLAKVKAAQKRKFPKDDRPPTITETIESRNMRLLELGPHDCRYPTSPDDATSHLFCGAPQAEGSSYCAHHAALVLRGQPRGAGRLGGNPDFKVGPQGRLRALTNDHHDLEMAAPDLPHGKTRAEHAGSSS